MFTRCHIEVKTTIIGGDKNFHIQGEKQLDDIQGKHLFLANPILENSDIGHNINKIIESIQEKYEFSSIEKQTFMESLNRAGYHIIHYDYYESEGIRIQVETPVIYKVENTFPRILPDSYSNKISVKKYSVSADACAKFIYSEQLPID